MIRRLFLITLALLALGIGYTAGSFLFMPALKLSFGGWLGALPGDSAAEMGAATLGFSLALSSLWGMVPVSALVTERFATRAPYSQALAKSALIGGLAFGAALLYQHEHLASLQRLAVRMPQFFSNPVTHLADNPLTKIVWFTAVCLMIFGPLDLWIARLQKKSSESARATSGPETGN